eukprot:NODE_4152_length_834_cov_30.343706_g3994_i0.p1 GENE.NODE_4152_length_834_cov_30.343706_g3994_i0~~NODE_4152_length_834_cov_30.343706_g3994_i0.p1  ORF type:complete len:219 (-),score=49.03 NODE_4152_length_834_cov_30.343706_g3994_i0:127-783(-)
MMLVRLLILLCFSLCSSFYFKLEGKMCFADEVGFEREPAHVHYRCPILNPNNRGIRTSEEAKHANPQAYFIQATVTDPEHNLIHNEVLRSENNSFSFLSTGIAGEYHVCFEPSVTLASFKPNLYVEIESGANIDYSKVQTVEGLSKMDAQLKELKTLMQALKAEMAYVKKRQVPFHRTSESTHRRVCGWSLIQLGILFVMSGWQIWHLKRFFMAKKLV